jgi:hypothetical protein
LLIPEPEFLSGLIRIVENNPEPEKINDQSLAFLAGYYLPGFRHVMRPVYIVKHQNIVKPGCFTKYFIIADSGFQGMIPVNENQGIVLHFRYDPGDCIIK